MIVPVARLPASDPGIRADILQKLTAYPPSKTSWEVGGAANFMIAAARLGQRVGCLGQLGNDVFGDFFRSVMLEEGVKTVQLLSRKGPVTDFLTLVCFVLIDPRSNHAFTSRYDFGPWPLLDHITSLDPDVLKMVSDSRALMLNGFVLDELPGPLVVKAAVATRDGGGAVFFDPGPRSWTLLEGERRASLDAILNVADVVLMTQEEAEALTGCSDPRAAGSYILARPAAATAWVIVKLGSDGAVLCARGANQPIYIDGLNVPVQDTVGCGDSFAAAIVLGFIQGQSAETTLALANAVGAATAMSRGAGRGVASPDTVLALLRAQSSGLGLSPTDSNDTQGSPTATVVAAVQSSTDTQDGHEAWFGKGSSNKDNGGTADPPQPDAFGLQTPAVLAINLLATSLNDE